MGKMVFLWILSGAPSAFMDDTVCKNVGGTVIIILGCDGCVKTQKDDSGIFLKQAGGNYGKRKA